MIECPEEQEAERTNDVPKGVQGTDLTDGWSDREIAERWGRLYPPRDKKRQPLPVTDEWIEQKLADKAWIARTRKRLAKLGWFMKCLKEPLARMANKEDGVKGHFWEGRYKSIAILDTEALLATCAYVDLNPMAAGLAPVPEESDYTSIKARIERGIQIQGICPAWISERR